MIDGMGGEEIRSGSVAGMPTQNPYFIGSVVADGGHITKSSVEATGSLVTARGVDATGSVVSEARTLSAVALGSPAAAQKWGCLIQAGSGATGAGSNVWHVFPTAFGSAPICIVQNVETLEASFCPAGSLVAGSIYVESTSASQDFYWIAIGPRA